MWRTHRASVEQRLTIERSFQLFRCRGAVLCLPPGARALPAPAAGAGANHPSRPPTCDWQQQIRIAARPAPPTRPPRRDSLLAHSLHRPPFSAGVFPQQQAPQLLAWALSSYYRHYKLYQYAFTPRVTLELSSHAAGAEVEAPAQPAALQQALGPEEYQELLAEQERQVGGPGGRSRLRQRRGSLPGRERPVAQGHAAAVVDC